MQVWNVPRVARWKYRTQKSRQKSPSGHHRTILLGYIFATKAHINNRKKNLLSSNISSTCLHNMVNFGSLSAEIGPVVWGTPCKLQRVSRLGSVTARHCSSGRQPNFVALNRGRHLYSAGRPSRWALAHISTVDLKFRDHFTLRTSSTTRGHDYKLFLTYSRLNVRKRFFCESCSYME